MTTESLRTRMLRGDMLAGTFLKTPNLQMIEILAMSGMDFVCLDAEHAPFDRSAIDGCMAVGRAMKFPIMVRVPDGNPAEILKALDCGATGLVIPHVATPEKAANISKWSRFGHGGRGYAGSSRWASYTTKTMPELLQQSQDETIVIAQIEEPEGVEAIDAIASTEGIDGLFVGPADLAVCLGVNNPTAPEVMEAMATVGAAAKQHGCAAMTFIPNMTRAQELADMGLSMFFVASEQSFILDAARGVAADLKNVKKA